MNTKNYQTPTATRLWQMLLVFAILFHFNVSAQHCSLLPMTLEQRVQTAPLIIEGEVLSQQSFWSTGHQTIYTLNKVKVYKIFKGIATASIIDVITEGGTVGMSRIVHTSTLSLAVGDMGVLMCIPNPYADSGVGGYTPYGSLAGFVKYEDDGSAHDPYANFEAIETGLHQSIKAITNLNIIKVANNPKLAAVLNKNSGNGGNGNKQVGGGMQVEATPTITSFTPTSVASGIGSTITITGTNFGASRGTGGVEFRNADDGGATWIRPLSTDYVSWSSTQIVVKVPSTNASGNGAGTGQIRVVNSDASSNTATSAQTLTVTYAYSNLIYDNNARMATHVKDNMAGGYTFLLDQSTFASNAPAVGKFRLTLDRWTCTSGINWLIGSNTTAAVAEDGMNIACYSASLPASVLARCTSYYSGCGSTPFDWYVKEIDVAVKSNMPAGTSWYYGTGTPSATEYDFETVILHELGHGHQLNHVIDAAAVMHYAVAAGQVKRTLNAGDIAGSTFVKNRSLSVGGICGQSAMTLLACGAGNAAPIVNFSADRTNITVGCSVTFTSESLPQATGWSWNFNGGAANSTLENPTVTFNTPGTYTVSLTANNAAGGNTLTRTNYIVVTALTCSATNTNHTGSFTDYNYTGGGKLVGHNVGGDLAFADKFLYCGTPTKLTQLKYYFNISTGTGNITAKVWNANGAGGAPGTELFSQTVAIASIPDFATPTTVNIPSGLLLTGDYYIGFEIAYAGSDAVSLVSNAQGESAVSSAWRKSSGGTWDSYLALYGSSLSLFIEGVINNAPVATITPGGPTTFCSGNNVLLSANTGSGLTYQWFNGATNTGITTSTYTATTSGSYTVRTTYSGCSTTSSATVVTVNTCASNNANLNNLVLSSGTLNPVFSSVTTSYSASVANATTAITVTPTVAEANATVTVNNVAVVSGSPSGAIALNVGPNVITTVVTAQDGTTTKTYTVTVTRAPSSNANLANLDLSSGTLNPGFAQATTSYTASVSNATNSITVTPTVADATATVTVNLTPVTSGSPSGAIALSVGSNVITITVTAQDASIKTYTVTVTRAQSSNADLSNLVVSSSSLFPDFNPTTTDYSTTVSFSTTNVTVTATVADAGATVTVNSTPVTSGTPSGSIGLNVGDNTITTTVTAPDGSTKTYTIHVTRLGSSLLTNLVPSIGSLNPGFFYFTFNYTVNVTNSTNFISFIPTAEDATATIRVNGNIVQSGFSSPMIELSVGNNNVTVQVDAVIGGSDFYNVNIVRNSPQNADLTNLVPNSGTLNPVFDSATTNYSVAVPAATTTIRLTPTAVALSGATITVNGIGVASGAQSGNIALNLGVNVIPVVVTSQDGSLTKTYTVTVYRGSNNADLSSLSVGGGSLNPVFNAATTSYNVTVPTNQTFTIVTASAAVPGVIRINGSVVANGSPSSNINLFFGTNSINVTVTAQDGVTTKTYLITVFRPPSTDANLTNLVLSSGTLNPSFASNTTNYMSSVANAISSITVTATRSNGFATIRVNGQLVTSGSPSQSIPLSFGANIITVLVTAQDGTTTKTYTVNVVREASSNAELSNLVLSSGTLNPAFAGATTSYTASVPHATSTINVTPTVADPLSTVQVNGFAVSSGSPSQNITLSVGDNVILVVVTAQNGTTNTYTVTVNRAVGSNPNLSDIFLSTGTLSPAFAQNTTSYAASVSHATTSILVAPFAVEATATITVNGVPTPSGSFSPSIPLNVGSNVITIHVTAQSGATKTYTVTVTRAADSNADLSNLTVSAGTLNPSFSPGTNIYNVSVAFATSSMNVTPTASSAFASITVNGNPVASGSPSANIALNVGSNIISVAVTAQDGSVKVYVVEVTRAQDIPTPTSNISGSTSVCSTDTLAAITVNLTGTAPWTIYISDGNLTEAHTAFASPHTFFVNPTSTATYTVVDLIDANFNANPGDLTGSATITVIDAMPYFADADGDGFGNLFVMQLSCSVPIIAGNPGVTNALDCDDTNANISMQFSFYVDGDGDGHGTGPVESVCAIDAVTPPAGYSVDDTDCDDSDNTIYQSATLFVDGDGDGYSTGTQTVCYGATIPLGYSDGSLGEDCDDNDVTNFRNGELYFDADNDGYTSGTTILCYGASVPLGYAEISLGEDCDDNDADVFQSGPLYVDGDGDFYTNGTATVCYGDAIPIGYADQSLGDDCDDNDPSVFQSNILFVDNDGDGYDAGITAVCYGSTIPLGYSDQSFGSDCDDNNAVIFESVSLYIDSDGDGYDAGNIIACAGTTPPAGFSFTTQGNDCDDSNAGIHEQFEFFGDVDGDGFGTGAPVMVCAVDATTPPGGYSLNNTDCDDSDNMAYQSAVLYLDADGDGYDAGTATICYGATIPPGFIVSSFGADCNDANAAVNIPFAFYADQDSDGYGAGSLVMVCAINATTPPAGYSLNNTDCNDSDDAVYQSETLYVDADGDGYTSGMAQTICYGATIPAGYLVLPTAIDCNDNLSSVYPNATEVPFNGIDDDCDGFTDETGSLGITTTLLPSSCGTTLPTIGTLIGIQTVSGHPITGYRIRASNGAEVQILEKTVPHFTMTQFPSYTYATTYTIEIQLQRAGIWQGNWGASCLVSTPAILEAGGAAAISPSQCGIVLPKINTLIATTSMPGVTGYRFRVTNLTDPLGPNAVQTIDRTQHWFSLQMLTRYNYGTAYRIEVAVKTTGSFGGYGTPCNVTSPAPPALINCGGTIASGTATVAATSVSGATQYRFQIARDSDGATTTIDRSNNWFIFNSVPASIFTPGALYNVRVAVMTTGTWSPFGDACQITAPGGSASAITEGGSYTDLFKVAAYPSPFTSDFMLDVTTSSTAHIQIKVYDMLGKELESREVRLEDIGIEKIGSKYPSGVYNVVVNQDDAVKTLRVIKR